jgi:hypothetical protein
MPKETEKTQTDTVSAGDATHAEPTMSVTQVMELLRATVAANALTPDKMQEIISAVAGSVAKAANPVWWDERTYHEKSVFSYPEGNLARPKPKLTRDVLWAGYRIDTDEMTPAEIEAVNQIQPGSYHSGQWVVLPLDRLPVPKTLLVLFPCKDYDVRQDLRCSDGSEPTMLNMCREMTPQVAESVA